MDFSGKGPGLPVGMAMMTTQSPEGTDFTFPLYHPVAPLADDAIYNLRFTHTHTHRFKFKTTKLFFFLSITHWQIHRQKACMHNRTTENQNSRTYARWRIEIEIRIQNKTCNLSACWIEEINKEQNKLGRSEKVEDW